MNVIDIIIVILLLISAFYGYKKGLCVQLGGLVGLIIGCWIAYRVANTVARLCHITGEFAYYAGFAIVLVAVIIITAILARTLRGLFKLAGIDILDNLGGVMISLIKSGILIGLALMIFDAGNKEFKMVAENRLKESIFYYPVKSVPNIVFPYTKEIKKRFDSSMNKVEPLINSEE